MINRKRIEPTTFAVALQPDGKAVITVDADKMPLEVVLSSTMWEKLVETVKWFEAQEKK